MPPQGMTALDLPKLIKQYFDLSPDLFVQENYFAAVNSIDGWCNASVGWDWLRTRLEQDCTPLKNIAEWDCADDWWESI